ncbi:MAG: peptidylprolyl isomerase, partial [Spirochaetota bacterium]|nr:peptidylprolyl isomerase [Spirochaetota bacterium]
ETAAKKYSDDRKNKNRGGMLGWYDKTNLEKLTKKYAEIAFSLKVGEVSHIIISDEAIHIIKVLDKKPSRLIPYSEAKKMIMSAIIRERASKQLQNMIEIKKKRSDIDIFL